MKLFLVLILSATSLVTQAMPIHTSRGYAVRTGNEVSYIGVDSNGKPTHLNIEYARRFQGLTNAFLGVMKSCMQKRHTHAILLVRELDSENPWAKVLSVTCVAAPGFLKYWKDKTEPKWPALPYPTRP